VAARCGGAALASQPQNGAAGGRGRRARARVLAPHLLLFQQLVGCRRRGAGAGVRGAEGGVQRAGLQRAAPPQQGCSCRHDTLLARGYGAELTARAGTLDAAQAVR